MNPETPTEHPELPEQQAPIHPSRTRYSLLFIVVTLLTLSAVSYYVWSSNTPVDTLQTPTSPPTPQPTLSAQTPYSIVDTGQTSCFNTTTEISPPATGDDFYGQDCTTIHNLPSLSDNGDGTVTDAVTGLMWQQDPGAKMTYMQAAQAADQFTLAGYSDWRLPTIKELYSLIDFRGADPSGMEGSDTTGLTPFLNADVYTFAYGNPADGDRIIDSQWATSTLYESTVMNNQQCMFGVNFADGRIKCYPLNKTFYVIYVRGNPQYGSNDLQLQSDTVVVDHNTGLYWERTGSSVAYTWQEALAYCEQSTTGGFNDWRLPHAKELQSIVDYARSPATTNSAAIDPLFNTVSILSEANEPDFPYYWSSTTHLNSTGDVTRAVYISFGRAMGYMQNQWVDVHGAGAQRSDPKTGNPDQYPSGHGPQGDAIRIYNFARCVRGESHTYNGQPTSATDFPVQESNPQPTTTPPVPPAEAITACHNQPAESICSFRSPTGTVTGTCKTVQNQTACVPY